MKTNIILVLLFFSIFSSADHLPFPGKTIPPAQYYRDFNMKLRTQGGFEIPAPGSRTPINYSFSWDTPAYDIPILSDFHFDIQKPFFLRSFFDRIFFKSDSFVEINGEKLPLTCVFIEGQDNRFSDDKESPLLPDYVFKVYLVANDFSCQGPLKPGWPDTGGRDENWDTYIYYEIRDPTIMLPTDAKLRYRWNEYSMVLVDKGQ